LSDKPVASASPPRRGRSRDRRNLRPSLHVFDPAHGATFAEGSTCRACRQRL